MPYNTLSMERRIKSTFLKIEKSIYERVSELDVTAWLTKEPKTFENKMAGEKTILKPGDNWGNLFDCAWMNLRGSLPDNFKHYDFVLVVDISGEACIVNDKGEPVQGITTFASMYDFTLGMPGKKYIYLDKLVDDEGNLDIWMDAGNNDLFGNLKNNGTLTEAYIAKVNRDMRDYFYDFEVLNELRNHIPKNKAQYSTISIALYKSSLQLNKYDNNEAIEAKKILAPELARRNIDSPLKITAIGHAHIDLAWLWPIRESIRKGARTFSTALMNIEKYPDYIFGASQPQLYQWMKDSYPNLYKRIKEAVRKGRWELQGAMWVESDTNVTGGEALIRQLLYGKKFYKKEFGEDINNLWLPDVFGYSGALPQILKKSDVDYFMTIKLSWSEFNKFPHHTFKWQGIDGSEVLAHMPPEGNYNSSAAPRAIIAAEEKFMDKGYSDECLLLYGIGDGGGGPGEEHIERLNREKNLQSLAPVKQEFAKEFFNRIAKNIVEYKTWIGELYLEHHRGTYTSEGRNKKYNKVMENLLRDIEIISIMFGLEYDFERIEKIWKEVLLYQFHDILPGSSIKRVYDESLKRYGEIENEIISMLQKSISSNGKNIKVINTSSWERYEWIKHDNNWLKANVEPMSSVILNNETHNLSYDVQINEELNQIQNDSFIVSFNNDGSIKSVFDRSNSWEAIKSGFTANNLSVYINDGDAWDFPHDYKDLYSVAPELQSYSYELDGPEAIRTNVFKTGDSIITQSIVLRDGASRVDIRNKINWKEKNTLLRASFPLNVSSNNLTCGIQFGYIERPSHNNTDWDMAKFEVCGQNYVDISQIDQGVAILSDYKYGYSSSLDTIEISLLSSTTFPDVTGDIGLHEFTYSIYPHTGNHIVGEVIKEALELSRPLRVVASEENCEQSSNSFIKTSQSNIIIETIKRSEDGKGFIVRMYEAEGRKVNTSLSFNKTYKSISEVNLIERQLSDEVLNVSGIFIEFNPFEIKTLLLQ